MSDTNEKEWWSEMYLPLDRFDYSYEYDIPAIIAEAERRKVKEIREEIERLKRLFVSNVALNALLTRDCLKDE